MTNSYKKFVLGVCLCQGNRTTSRVRSDSFKTPNRKSCALASPYAQLFFKKKGIPLASREMPFPPVTVQFIKPLAPLSNDRKESFPVWRERPGLLSLLRKADARLLL